MTRVLAARAVGVKGACPGVVHHVTSYQLSYTPGILTVYQLSVTSSVCFKIKVKSYI